MEDFYSLNQVPTFDESLRMIAWKTDLTLNLASNTCTHNCILRCIHISFLKKRCSKRKACRNQKQCEALHICITSGRSWFHWGGGGGSKFFKDTCFRCFQKSRAPKEYSLISWKSHKQALDVYKSKFRTFPLTCWCLRAMSWSFYGKTLKFFKDVCQLCFEVFPIAVHQKKGSQVSETGRRWFQIQM